jgi:hypothetical protein
MEATEKFQWGQKRRRSDSSIAQSTMAQMRAAEIPREGGRFVKSKVTVGSTSVGCGASRSGDNRLRQERDNVRRQFADLVQEHKESRNAETAQWTKTMHVLNGKISARETELRSMRRTNQILKRKLSERAASEGEAANGGQPRVKLAQKLIGGTSAGVKSKLATEMENFLVFRFATKQARQQALYEHHRRFPEDYSLVINYNISEQEFAVLCA